MTIAPAAKLLAATTTAPAAGQSARHVSVGSRIVVGRSETVIEGMNVRLVRLRRMIDACLMRLSGKITPARAWAKYVRPGAKVLLKFTRLPGGNLATEGPMLEAMLASLTRSGYSLSNILVAGYPHARHIEGLAPVPTGWSNQTVAVNGSREQLPRYLDGVETIINVPSICDHNLAGLTCAMTNVSLDLIRRPARYYGDDLHKSIVSIFAAAPIAQRTTLTIVNALRYVYDGGPLSDGAQIAPGNGIWLSSDPVAVDRLALEWIEQQRSRSRLAGLTASGRPASYIDLAGARGLGVADLRRIIVDTHRM